MAVGEDYYYYSDSDDDVDRYVFLARRPVGDHAVDDDAIGDESTEDASGAAASPSSLPGKKARLIIASVPSEETSSGMDRSASSSPSGGVRDKESSSSGSEEEKDDRRDEAHGHPDHSPRKGKGNKINKTKNLLMMGACGKRRRSCVEEAGQVEPRRAVTAAAAAANKTTSPSSSPAGRFQCSLCERCFDSHQALGGHIRGHQRKARIAAAGGRGNRASEIAMVELVDAVGYAEAEQKASAAAAVGADDDDGACHEKKQAFDGIDGAACREDNVDTGGRRKAKKKKKTSVVVAEERTTGARGDGSIDVRASDFAARGECVNDHDRGSLNGSEETAIGARRSRSDADAKNKKAAAGASSRNKGGAANDSGIVGACRTLYKCKVCDTECLTGRALGGHMSKHRKLPA